jgi:hypothetical protein
MNSHGDPEQTPSANNPNPEQEPRKEDLFDRIGRAFPHERQRLVLEELLMLIKSVDAIADETATEASSIVARGGKSIASRRTEQAKAEEDTGRKQDEVSGSVLDGSADVELSETERTMNPAPTSDDDTGTGTSKGAAKGKTKTASKG